MSSHSETHVPRMKRISNRRSSTVTVLDVGSTKICCLIARLKPQEDADMLPGRTHSVKVLGYGYQRSRGIKSGAIIDMDQAEHAIRLAVDAAERMAGVTVESLIVSISCGRLSSEAFSANVSIGGAEVTEADIQRVLAAGSRHSVGEGRTVVHSLPIGYALDGNRGIADPIGMYGDRLSVDMHVIAADQVPVRNFELCLERAHLQTATMVAAPYASGLASLVDDEAELGVACVDMGGGTTSLAIFADGHCVHVDGIALGGHHVTMDLARGLSTRLQDAERLKTLYGNALPSEADDTDVVTVLPVGDEESDVPQNVPKSTLNGIIRPRVEEILELVRDRLNASGFAGRVDSRVVLTGGASQLTGMAEAAARIMGRNVRIGRPLGVSGLPEAAKGPGFSTAIGLMIYPQVARIEQFEARSAGPRKTGTGGYFSRVGQWIRDSF